MESKKQHDSISFWDPNTERRKGKEGERKRGQMQSPPFWELWTGTEKRVKLKAYDERVLSGHHEDEKEREISHTWQSDGWYIDFPPFIILPGLRERVKQFYSPHVRVCCRGVSAQRARTLHTNRDSQGACCVFNLQTHSDINQPASPCPDDCLPSGPT